MYENGEANGGGAGKIIGKECFLVKLYLEIVIRQMKWFDCLYLKFPWKNCRYYVDPGKEVIIQKSAFLASRRNGNIGQL